MKKPKITQFLESDRAYCDCGGALEGYGWWLKCCKCGRKFLLPTVEIEQD